MFVSAAEGLAEASPLVDLPTTAGRGSSRMHSKFSRLQWSQTGYIEMSASRVSSARACGGVIQRGSQRNDGFSLHIHWYTSSC